MLKFNMHVFNGDFYLKKDFDVYFKNLPCSILIFNRDGDVVYYNDKLNKLFENNKIDRYSAQDFFNNESISNIMIEAFSDNDFLFDFDSLEFHLKKDVILNIKGNFSVINNQNSKFLLCSFEIIKNDLDNKEHLNKVDSKLKLILDLIPTSVVIHNESGVLFYNNACLETFKLRKEDVRDLVIFDFIVNEYVEFSKDRIKKALCDNEIVPLADIKLTDFKGNVFDAEAQSIPINFLGQSAVLTVIRDISKYKNLERQLLEKELLFRTLTEFTVSAIFIYQDNKFVDLNKAAEIISGYSREELINSDYKKIIHPDYADLLEQNKEARLQGKSVSDRYELKIKNKSGKELWVDFSARLTNWNNKPAIIGTAIDITDKKKVEHKLIESEKRFKSMFKNHPVAQLIINPFTFIIEDANDSACKFYGYEFNDIVGMSYRDITETESPIFQKNMKRILNKSKRYFQAKHSMSDGSIVDVEIYANPIDIAGTKIIHAMIFDITEVVNLEKLNQILYSSIEQSPLSIVITDYNGFIIYVNPTFEKVTGYSEDEVIHEKPNILKSGEHDNEFYENLWATISSGKTWHGQIINKNKNGKLYTEDMIIAPIFNNNGEITHYVSLKTDITEKLALEEKFHQAQKLESVGRLAGGIAHDFNNMLNIISNYTEILLREINKKSKNYEHLLEIRKAVKDSANLISQLLGYARKQKISPVILNLNEVINEQLNMIKRLIREEIEIIWKTYDELWTIKMDRQQFSQILMNICVNADDAIKGKGYIKITTSNKIIDDSDLMKFDFLQEEYVLLTIEDNGTGVDNEIIEHIFEPFYTTKGVYGTGLGLSTVYGIVKQNKGFIDVTSNLGVGTKFEIYLPRFKGEPENEIQENIETTENYESKSIEKINKGKTILIVEDQEAILSALEKVLASSGYNVITSDNPLKALDIAKDKDIEMDLLITDVIMPEMDGKVLSEKILKIHPNIKVLFMSGYSEDIISNRGILFDEINFIQKPFDIDSFLSTIKYLLS